MTVFLIGFMGCGKSSVGKRIASETGYSFYDTDRLIEEEARLPIADIFSRYGEDGFRRAEKQMLLRICSADYRPQEQVAVIATGGGMACSEENITLMKKSGLTIYLRRSAGNLFDRLKDGRRRRPKISALDEKELLGFINSSLAQRERFYCRAEATIDCDGLSDESTAKLIEAVIAEKLRAFSGEGLTITTERTE